MKQLPVPVVRAIIMDSQGRLLLLRRCPGSAGAGQWCLPGGKVDYGVPVAQAVYAELAEETGLHCCSAEFLFYRDSLPLMPGGMHCINFYFHCLVTGEVVLNEESTEHAWVPVEALEKYDIAFRNEEGIHRYLTDTGEQSVLA